MSDKTFANIAYHGRAHGRTLQQAKNIAARLVELGFDSAKIEVVTELTDRYRKALEEIASGQWVRCDEMSDEHADEIARRALYSQEERQE